MLLKEIIVVGGSLLVNYGASKVAAVIRETVLLRRADVDRQNLLVPH